jgi:hypothetical protein
MTENDFLRIRWPEVFRVIIKDGSTLTLAAGEDGVTFSPAADDPSCRGFIAAADAGASRSARTMGRVCYLDEIVSIVTVTGQVLWVAPG